MKRLGREFIFNMKANMFPRGWNDAFIPSTGKTEADGSEFESSRLYMVSCSQIYIGETLFQEKKSCRLMLTENTQLYYGPLILRFIVLTSDVFSDCTLVGIFLYISLISF